MSKALEEGALVATEAVDNGDRCGARCREQLLIGLKKPLVVLEVGVVVVVERVHGRWVEVGEDGAASILWAKLLESGQV